MFLRIFLITAVAAVSASVAAVPTDGDTVVLHAEPPTQSPLARIFPTTVNVKVDVAPDGTVSKSQVLAPRPPFVASLAEDASCKWRFSADRAGSKRSYVLTFVFAPVATTDEPSHWFVTTEDLIVRVQYLQTTVRRLDRDEHGDVARRFCPRHRIRMELGVVPIAYGLPRSYSSDNPADRAVLQDARQVWRAKQKLFPEANMTVAGGGCFIQPEKVAEVHYCVRCRRAREEWFRRHPRAEQYE